MHHLASLLQHQLATDSSAFAHLSVIITSLKPSDLSRSSHTAKWISRINSLLSSKDSALKWTGLCLAKTTADFNPELLLEEAQSWISITVPFLSRSEPLPVVEATVQLLFSIFSSTLGMPEFQRRVAIPIVPKVTQALIAQAEKALDAETQVIVLDALESFVRLYPSLTKVHQASITKLALSELSGSFPNSKPPLLVQAAATLLATSHFTGGKVGGGTTWRKLLDCAINSALEATYVLKSTFEENKGQPQAGFALPAYPEDLMVSIPLALDRLKCMMVLIGALLKSSVVRPVSVPLGSLVNLTETLLQGAPDPEMQTSSSRSFVDPSQHALELSLVPESVMLGCDLLHNLTSCVQHYLTPHATALLSLLCHHLTMPTYSATTRCHLLRCVTLLVQRTHAFHSSVLPSQITKAVLTSITPLLDDAPNPSTSKDANGSSVSAHRKGKKKAKGFEGDELFNSSKFVTPILTSDKSWEVEAALDALQPLIRSGFLSSNMLSLVHRVLLSLILTLPQRTAASLSSDPSVYNGIISRLSTLCSDLTTATSNGWASRSLGTIITAISRPHCNADPEAYPGAIHHLEHVLHPRLLPVLRSLPGVESLVLFKKEEGEQEKGAREDLGLVNMEGLDRLEVLETEAPSSGVALSSSMTGLSLMPTTNGKPTSSFGDLPQFDHTLTVVEGPYIQNRTSSSGSMPLSANAVQSNQLLAPTPLIQAQSVQPQEVQTANPVNLPGHEFIKPGALSENQTLVSQEKAAEAVDSQAMVVDVDGGDDEEIPAIDIDSESEAE